jgi:hypothetical protein
MGIDGMGSPLAGVAVGVVWTGLLRFETGDWSGTSAHLLIEAAEA